MEIKECRMLLICESHLPCLQLGICAVRSAFLKCRCVSKMQSWNKSDLCFLKTVTLKRCSCLREDSRKWCGPTFALLEGSWNSTNQLLSRSWERVSKCFLTSQRRCSNYVWSKRVLSFCIRRHMDSTLNWSKFIKADEFTTFLEHLARIRVGGRCCGRWPMAELAGWDVGTFVYPSRQAVTNFIVVT